MKKWKKLKPHQFAGLFALDFIYIFCLLGLLLFYGVYRRTEILLAIFVLLATGVPGIVIVYLKSAKLRKVSTLIEQFIRRNDLYQSHYVTEQGALGVYKSERIDYYPTVEYREKVDENIFCVRVRLDGSLKAEKFRNLEQELADMFHTVCTDKIEERGTLTYCFERRAQKQMIIRSQRDVLQRGESEIVFSDDIVWDWRRTKHLLVTGNTGSGKTKLIQWIIACLVLQGVKVIYCDPKNDDDMRLFMQNYPSVRYVTKENEIAKAVRETEEEIRIREMDLNKIGLQEGHFFDPIFLIFDEMIAFAKLAEKKIYEETEKRFSAIVVMGRSKEVYAGMILQRPDTVFIEGAIRDGLGCRICMGQMSKTAYKMVFGDSFADVKNYRHETGSGLIFRQGVDTKPREFLAPYIEKGALNRRE